jgi:hypothetical protein
MLFLHVFLTSAMPHTHKIPENSPLTERHDPITGDAFQAGDKVVFCANCHSAFLADSWKYMGGLHCGQSRTLRKIPALEEINLGKRLEEIQHKTIKEDTFIFEMKNAQTNFYRTILTKKSHEDDEAPVWLPYAVVFMFGFAVLPPLFMEVASSVKAAKFAFILFISIFVLLLFYYFIFVRPKQKHKNKIENPVKKPKNIGFHLGEYFLYLIEPVPKKVFRFLLKPSYKTYNYADLKYIALSYSDNEGETSLNLKAETKEGETIHSSAKLPKREVPFYLRTGLLEISQYTPVHYAPLDEKDQKVIENLMQRYRNDVKLYVG